MRFGPSPAGAVPVRRAGSFSEQFDLLFRDYLRAHPAEAADYERLKQTLAGQFERDRDPALKTNDATVVRQPSQRKTTRRVLR